MTGPASSIAVSLAAHSRMVRLLRLVLPASILGLTLLLAAMMITHAVTAREAAPRETTSSFHMSNPHFFGRDSQGRAFEISAAEAARSDRNMQEVLLDHVTMTLDASGPNPSRLSADHGVYREDTRILRLTDNVHLDDGRASSVATNLAIVDTRAGTVTGGNAPVQARSPTGAMQAGTYTASRDGQRATFGGRVHARLDSH